ncbi:hypothetical protein BT69DRAFT_1346103 [Atractiella rhizophila]|nr:hypothetical protein BT69DRAFT_1346103 [Atractiella rhizophila]
MVTYADQWNSLPSSQALIPGCGYGPVQLILGDGGEEDEIVEMMDADHLPGGGAFVVDDQDVVANIRAERPGEVLEVEIDVLSSTNVNEFAYISPEGSVIVILDTNVLISHLSLLTSLFSLLHPSYRSPTTPLFIIPHIVLSELDGLKHSDRMVPLPSDGAAGAGRPRGPSQVKLGVLARRANETVLELIRQWPEVIRGQRRRETLRKKGTSSHLSGDDLILDCCLYFRHNHRPTGFLGLLSEDKNLCLKTEGEGIPSLNGLSTWNAEKLLSQLDPNYTPEPKQANPAHIVYPTMEPEADMEILLEPAPPAPSGSSSPHSFLSSHSPHVPPPNSSSHHPAPLLLDLETEEADPGYTMHGRICAFCAPFLSPFLYHSLLEETSLGMQDRLSSILSRHSFSSNFETWDLSVCLSIIERFWRNVFENYFAERFENRRLEWEKKGRSKTYHLQSIRTSLAGLKDAFGDKGKRECAAWTKGRWKNNLEMLSTVVLENTLLEMKIEGGTTSDRGMAEEYFELWKMQIETSF